MAEPTPGVRLETYVIATDNAAHDGVYFRPAGADYCGNEDQANVDATYINWLIETDERRREQSAKRAAAPGDLMVDLGNLEGTEKKFTAMIAALDSAQNQAYEDMVEEFIQSFNHIVIQGIDPLIAVYAMSQGLAIVLGFALRANLPFSIAQTILTQQMKSATASERMVRVITAPAGRG
jgi:hypothetical protein